MVDKLNNNIAEQIKNITVSAIYTRTASTAPPTKNKKDEFFAQNALYRETFSPDRMV